MLNWGSSTRPLDTGDVLTGRRGFLAGAFAVAALALPGCTTTTSAGGASSEAVRRLMLLATRDAFSRLMAPDGFWTSTVARIEVPPLFGKAGGKMPSAMRSPQFRESLQRELNTLAQVGAGRAEPVVEQAVRTIAIDDPAAILGGGRTGATTFLRTQMGPAVVNAMLPALTEALQSAQAYTVIQQAVAALSGVTLTDAAHALAIEADNAIWYEVGNSETGIRADPASTGDPEVTSALAA
jgi:hypothetical protein